MKKKSGFGLMMAKARLEKGLNQYRLGGMVGVSESMITRFEGDRSIPRADIFRKICDALELNPRNALLALGDRK